MSLYSSENLRQIYDDTSVKETTQAPDISKGSLQSELEKLRKASKDSCMELLDVRDMANNDCANAVSIMRSFTAEPVTSQINSITTDVGVVHSSAASTINSVSGYLTPTQYSQCLDALSQLLLSMSYNDEYSSLYESMFGDTQDSMEDSVGDFNGIMSCLLMVCFSLISSLSSLLSNMKIFSFLPKFMKFANMFSNFSMDMPFTKDMLFANITNPIDFLPDTKIVDKKKIIPDFTFPEDPDLSLPKFTQSNLSIPVPIVPTVDTIPTAPNVLGVNSFPRTTALRGGVDKLSANMISGSSSQLSSASSKMNTKLSSTLTDLSSLVTNFQGNTMLSNAQDCVKGSFSSSLGNLSSVLTGTGIPEFASIIAQATGLQGNLNSRYLNVTSISNTNSNNMLTALTNAISNPSSLTKFNSSSVPKIVGLLSVFAPKLSGSDFNCTNL